MMSGCLQPFSAAIRQGHIDVLGRELLTRKRSHDGSPFQGNRSPLAVAEHVVAHHLRKRKPVHAPSGAEHLESSLISEDEPALTVNDEQGHAHAVKDGM